MHVKLPKQIVFVLLSCAVLQILHAQNNAPPLPLFEHRLSNAIIEDLATGSLPQARAAAQLTYIGEYQKAQAINYYVPLTWGFDTLTANDRAYFAKFQPKDAVETIVAAAAKEQIVLINEAHHQPQHRVFTRQLLQGLYENGYRYFGLETLTNLPDSIERKFANGTTLNERGYPLNSMISGIYTSEPQMANLVREAIAIGFTVFKYEQTGEGREQNQAQNITNILMADPQAKILVHCGWYHLLEKENNGKRWMASYLAEYTGIDPFTIYQDILVEKYASPESPFYTMMHYDRPTVFVDEHEGFYNGFADNDYFDLLVYHPRTRFINNRPHWLYHYPGLQSYPVNDLKITYPCLIKAYKTGEDHTAMPIDIIEQDYINDPTVLCLPVGEYRLEIEGVNGDTMTQKIIIE